jgi:hypothetical protein
MCSHGTFGSLEHDPGLEEHVAVQGSSEAASATLDQSVPSTLSPPIQKAASRQAWRGPLLRADPGLGEGLAAILGLAVGRCISRRQAISVAGPWMGMCSPVKAARGPNAMGFENSIAWSARQGRAGSS